jgi:hypothetical protein
MISPIHHPDWRFYDSDGGWDDGHDSEHYYEGCVLDDSYDSDDSVEQRNAMDVMVKMMEELWD